MKLSTISFGAMAVMMVAGCAGGGAENISQGVPGPTKAIQGTSANPNPSAGTFDIVVTDTENPAAQPGTVVHVLTTPSTQYPTSREEIFDQMAKGTVIVGAAGSFDQNADTITAQSCGCIGNDGGSKPTKSGNGGTP